VRRLVYQSRDLVLDLQLLFLELSKSEHVGVRPVDFFVDGVLEGRVLLGQLLDMGIEAHAQYSFVAKAPEAAQAELERCCYLIPALAQAPAGPEGDEKT
jgi:hypothetical protein